MTAGKAAQKRACFWIDPDAHQKPLMTSFLKYGVILPSPLDLCRRL